MGANAMMAVARINKLFFVTPKVGRNRPPSDERSIERMGLLSWSETRNLQGKAKTLVLERGAAFQLPVFSPTRSVNGPMNSKRRPMNLWFATCYFLWVWM